MKIIKSIKDLKEAVSLLKGEGKRIGFVPTMGFLHKGHMSLVREAKEISDVVVMSIFVNPTQFGPNEDFDKYPRDFERDEKMANEEGVDLLFYPSVQEMYPEAYQTYVTVEEVTKTLCGERRPGHFRGVATIVLKLFNIVKPDVAVFGMKDAQQVRVLEKMVEDLNMDIKIVRGEIVREEDGLALSSRNKYLSEKERIEALCLRKSILLAKKMIEQGVRKKDSIVEKVKEFLFENGYNPRIDYFEIVNYDTLKMVDEIKGEVLVAGAFYIGKTRLIDNIVIVVN